MPTYSELLLQQPGGQASAERRRRRVQASSRYTPKSPPTLRAPDRVPFWQKTLFAALSPLQVFDIPRRVITSGLKEVTDLVSGDGFSFRDFKRQYDEGYGVGDFLREKNILQGSDGGNVGWWANRFLSFAGDSLLDPLSWTGTGAILRGARGGSKNLSRVLYLSRNEKALQLGVRKARAAGDEINAQRYQRLLENIGDTDKVRGAATEHGARFQARLNRVAGVDPRDVLNRVKGAAPETLAAAFGSQSQKIANPANAFARDAARRHLLGVDNYNRISAADEWELLAQVISQKSVARDAAKQAWVARQVAKKVLKEDEVYQPLKLWDESLGKFRVGKRRGITNITDQDVLDTIVDYNFQNFGRTTTDFASYHWKQGRFGGIRFGTNIFGGRGGWQVLNPAKTEFLLRPTRIITNTIKDLPRDLSKKLGGSSKLEKTIEKAIQHGPKFGGASNRLARAIIDDPSTTAEAKELAAVVLELRQQSVAKATEVIQGAQANRFPGWVHEDGTPFIPPDLDRGDVSTGTRTINFFSNDDASVKLADSGIDASKYEGALTGGQITQLLKDVTRVDKGGSTVSLIDSHGRVDRRLAEAVGFGDSGRVSVWAPQYAQRVKSLYDEFGENEVAFVVMKIRNLYKAILDTENSYGLDIRSLGNTYHNFQPAEAQLAAAARRNGGGLLPRSDVPDPQIPREIHLIQEGKINEYVAALLEDGDVVFREVEGVEAFTDEQLAEIRKYLKGEDADLPSQNVKVSVENPENVSLGALHDTKVDLEKLIRTDTPFAGNRDGIAFDPEYWDHDIVRAINSRFSYSKRALEKYFLDESLKDFELKWDADVIELAEMLKLFQSAHLGDASALHWSGVPKDQVDAAIRAEFRDIFGEDPGAASFPGDASKVYDPSEPLGPPEPKVEYGPPSPKGSLDAVDDDYMREMSELIQELATVAWNSTIGGLSTDLPLAATAAGKYHDVLERLALTLRAVIRGYERSKTPLPENLEEIERHLRTVSKRLRSDEYPSQELLEDTGSILSTLHEANKILGPEEIAQGSKRFQELTQELVESTHRRIEKDFGEGPLSAAPPAEQLAALEESRDNIIGVIHSLVRLNRSQMVHAGLSLVENEAALVVSIENYDYLLSNLTEAVKARFSGTIIEEEALTFIGEVEDRVRKDLSDSQSLLRELRKPEAQSGVTGDVSRAQDRAQIEAVGGELPRREMKGKKDFKVIEWAASSKGGARGKPIAWEAKGFHRFRLYYDSMEDKGQRYVLSWHGGLGVRAFDSYDAAYRHAIFLDRQQPRQKVCASCHITDGREDVASQLGPKGVKAWDKHVNDSPTLTRLREDKDDLLVLADKLRRLHDQEAQIMAHGGPVIIGQDILDRDVSGVGVGYPEALEVLLFGDGADETLRNELSRIARYVSFDFRHAMDDLNLEEGWWVDTDPLTLAREIIENDDWVESGLSEAEGFAGGKINEYIMSSAFSKDEVEVLLSTIKLKALYENFKEDFKGYRFQADGGMIDVLNEEPMLNALSVIESRLLELNVPLRSPLTVDIPLGQRGLALELSGAPLTDEDISWALKNVPAVRGEFLRDMPLKDKRKLAGLGMNATMKESNPLAARALELGEPLHLDDLIVKAGLYRREVVEKFDLEAKRKIVERNGLKPSVNKARKAGEVPALEERIRSRALVSQGQLEKLDLNARKRELESSGLLDLWLGGGFIEYETLKQLIDRGNMILRASKKDGELSVLPRLSPENINTTTLRALIEEIEDTAGADWWFEAINMSIATREGPRDIYIPSRATERGGTLPSLSTPPRGEDKILLHEVLSSILEEGEVKGVRFGDISKIVSLSGDQEFANPTLYKSAAIVIAAKSDADTVINVLPILARIIRHDAVGAQVAAKSLPQTGAANTHPLYIAESIRELNEAVEFVEHTYDQAVARQRELGEGKLSVDREGPDAIDYVPETIDPEDEIEPPDFYPSQADVMASHEEHPNFIDDDDVDTYSHSYDTAEESALSFWSQGFDRREFAESIRLGIPLNPYLYRRYQELLEYTNPLSIETEVWRGSHTSVMGGGYSTSHSWEVGDTLIFDTFTSGSTSIQTGRSFAGDGSNNDNVMIRIRAPEGTEAIVFNSEEGEVIFPPGTRMEVKRVVHHAEIPGPPGAEYSEQLATLYLEVEVIVDATNPPSSLTDRHETFLQSNVVKGREVFRSKNKAAEAEVTPEKLEAAKRTLNEITKDVRIGPMNVGLWKALQDDFHDGYYLRNDYEGVLKYLIDREDIETSEVIEPFLTIVRGEVIPRIQGQLDSEIASEVPNFGVREGYQRRIDEARIFLSDVEETYVPRPLEPPAKPISAPEALAPEPAAPPPPSSSLDEVVREAVATIGGDVNNEKHLGAFRDTIEQLLRNAEDVSPEGLARALAPGGVSVKGGLKAAVRENYEELKALAEGKGQVDAPRPKEAETLSGGPTELDGGLDEFDEALQAEAADTTEEAAIYDIDPEVADRAYLESVGEEKTAAPKIKELPKASPELDRQGERAQRKLREHDSYLGFRSDASEAALESLGVERNLFATGMERLAKMDASLEQRGQEIRNLIDAEKTKFIADNRENFAPPKPKRDRVSAVKEPVLKAVRDAKRVKNNNLLQDLKGLKRRDVTHLKMRASQEALFFHNVTWLSDIFDALDSNEKWDAFFYDVWENDRPLYGPPTPGESRVVKSPARDLVKTELEVYKPHVERMIDTLSQWENLRRAGGVDRASQRKLAVMGAIVFNSDSQVMESIAMKNMRSGIVNNSEQLADELDRLRDVLLTVGERPDLVRLFFSETDRQWEQLSSADTKAYAAQRTVDRKKAKEADRANNRRHRERLRVSKRESDKRRLSQNWEDAGFGSPEAEGIPTAVKEQLDLDRRDLIFNGFPKFLKQFGEWWRGWALATPGFHVRNFIGGMYNNIAYGGVSVTEAFFYTKETMKYLRGVRNNVPYLPEAGSKAAKFIDNLEFMIQGGSIVTSGYVSTEVSQAAAGSWRNFSAGLRGKDTTVHPFVGMSRDFAGALETIMRAMPGAVAMERYGSNSTSLVRQSIARTAINRLHFDYTDLSDFERRLKLVVPFYTWASRNFALQLDLMYSNPVPIILADRAFKTVTKDTDDPDYNPFFPDYYLDQGYVPISSNTALTLELPHNAYRRDVAPLIDVASGDGGFLSGPFKVFGEYSPFISSIVKLVTNRDWERGYELGGGIQRTSTLAGELFPAWNTARRLLAPTGLVGATENEKARFSGAGPLGGLGGPAASFLGVPFRSPSARERHFSSINRDIRDREFTKSFVDSFKTGEQRAIEAREAEEERTLQLREGIEAQNSGLAVERYRARPRV